MAAPPFDNGAINETFAEVVPTAVADTEVGAPGAVTVYRITTNPLNPAPPPPAFD